MLYESEFEEVKTVESKEKVTVKKCCYVCEHSTWELSDMDVESASLYCDVDKPVNRRVVFYDKVCDKFMLKNIII